jgi:hypothetical protein
VDGPVRVAFTDHAAERAQRYGVSYVDIADVLIGENRRRRPNAGSGDWVVRRRALVVVYNWPDRGDPLTARVVTLWSEE